MRQLTITFQEAIDFANAAYDELNFKEIRNANLYLDIMEYYLTGTYPPLKAMHPVSWEEVYVNASGFYDLYIHIPFCIQHCTFCHFSKEINAKVDRVEAYLDALQKEINLISRILPQPIRLNTIFFGGGTPSILNAHQIERIFNKLHQKFLINENIEITFELHPNMIYRNDHKECLKLLKKVGVNRWVAGVQSMNNKILEKLNRGHTAEDVIRFIEILNGIGIHNLSLDLIYGLPYQTINDWYDDIMRLIAGGVEKFNIFPLMFKISDPITRHYIKQPNIFPSEQERFKMNFVAEYLLQRQNFFSGPLFYYSKSTCHSKQQASKFEAIEETNLLALGASSFGYIGHTQFYNYPDINSYLDALNVDNLPIWRGITLNLEERMRRSIIFSLRSSGIHISKYAEKYKVHPYQKFYEEFKLLKELKLITEENDFVKLTAHGKLFIEGISVMFASASVQRAVMKSNLQELKKGNKCNFIEKFDFSPIGRIKQKRISEIIME